VGTDIISRIIPDFRNISCIFEVRFITASWPKNLLPVTQLLFPQSITYQGTSPACIELNPENGGKTRRCAILFLAAKMPLVICNLGRKNVNRIPLLAQ
jgi:hypothetical protein